MIRSIKELPHLSGVKVLVRADFNVPIENGQVVDPLRIGSILSSITYLLEKRAQVIITSHRSGSKKSLLPVFQYLKKEIPVSFVEDVVGPAANKAARSLKDGTALLLENLRWDSGEESNDPGFAKKLASLADVYVNDGFPVSHRPHASIVGVPSYLPGYAGFQFLRELENLTPALSPQSPSLAIIGGAKFVTKEKLIHALLKKYDKLFIGGAIANDFFLAKGHNVGRSLVSNAEHVRGLLKNSKIIIPTDVVVENPNGTETKDIAEVHDNDCIYDIGPNSLEALRPHAEKARIILWNGPMGNFENNFRQGTDEVARIVAASRAHSIVGGGDTLASIQSLRLSDDYTFVSTAGGAMLDFLANDTLPGIEALKNSPKLPT